MQAAKNKLAKLTWTLVLGLLPLALLACGGKVSDTNTNFGALDDCDTTAQCGSGLACRCGICTIACGSDADCEFDGVEGTCITNDRCEAVPLCFRRTSEPTALVGSEPDAASVSMCGNGVWEKNMGEECDGSDLPPGSDLGQCSADCKLVRCGNGLVEEQVEEQCDPGVPDGPPCNNDCSLSVCGDGKLGPDEACDPMVAPDCEDDCSRLRNCGDGKVDDGEECDPNAEGNSPEECTPTCKNRGCGNGIVDQIGESDEACDDGNTVAGDGCSANCESRESCGNGIVDRDFPDGEEDGRWEVCDDGNTRDGDFCSEDCKTAAGCGNSQVDPGEDCDNGEGAQEGRTIETAECNTDCRTPMCGDGIINKAADENCDKSSPADAKDCNGASAIRPDYTSAACHAPLCGDQYVNTVAGEQCEPVESEMDKESGDTRTCNGNQAPNEARCRLPQCGDGYINEQASEECEPSLEDGFNEDTKDSPTCNGDGEATPEGLRCKVATCGDGYTNETAGEVCDDGPETASCNRSPAATAAGVDCRPALCGDGYVNTAAGEECEPGADGEPVNEAGDSAGCNGAAGGAAACKPAACGDGYTNLAAGECGDAPGDSAQCNSNLADRTVACKAQHCGDGYVNAQAGELCDALALDTASCDADCTTPQCGDEHLNLAAGEECELPSPLCNGPSAGVLACSITRCGDGYCNPESEYGGAAEPDAGTSEYCPADCA